MSEAEGVSKRFDPRFSPAFQPGFDPRVHREEPPPIGFREQQPVRHDDLILEPPGFAVPAVDEADGSRDGSDSRVNFSAPTSAPDAVDEDLRTWWHRVNPWFLVLWALGIGFIAVGVLAVSWAVNGQTTGESQSGSQVFFLLLQMSWTASPMLIALGLATITSTVVMKAATWGRR